MDMTDRIAAALGASPLDVAPLSGGDVSQVVAGRAADGRDFVAKTGNALVEAEMLRAIAASGCPAPDVIHAEDDLLIMTRLVERPADPAGWRAAGHAIAGLHATPGELFGWHVPTAFGSAPCPAGHDDDWAVFWVEKRLLAWPEALPSDVARRVERVAGKAAGLLDHAPAPRLLHGDMWSGNVLFDGQRFSGLIDPACYYGDPEVDLALLTLFGRPPQVFWDAYGPLPEGWEARRPLYTLWPALVHLRLFGGSYRSMVERLLDRLGA